MAESFQAGVEALMESKPSEEDIDEFIGRFAFADAAAAGAALTRRGRRGATLRRPSGATYSRSGAAARAYAPADAPSSTSRRR